MEFKIVGFVVWLSLFISRYSTIIQLNYIQLALLLVTLVYIPWGLSSLMRIEIKYRFFLLISLFNTISFQIQQGTYAALFVIPWVVYSILLFSKHFTFDNLHIMNTRLKLSSIFFIPGASSALFISRLGLQPFGFSHAIIELTGVHFHYSGVMVPLFFSAILDIYPKLLNQWIYNIIVFGTLIVALGITIGSIIPMIGMLSVTIFAGSLLFTSIKLVWFRPNLYLTIAHITLFITMCFAFYYAYGVTFEVVTISISWMVLTHGIANGLIFVPLSLYGWNRPTIKL